MRGEGETGVQEEGDYGCGSRGDSQDRCVALLLFGFGLLALKGSSPAPPLHAHPPRH